MTRESILFVCTGNICRSAMAERLAPPIFLARGRAVTVASVGTLRTEGHRAPPEALAVLAEVGLDLSSHRSRPLTKHAVRAATWIVVMAPEHELEVIEESPDARARLHRLWEFAPTRDDRIPDPYGGSLLTFRASRDLIQASLERWVAHVVAPAS